MGYPSVMTKSSYFWLSILMSIAIRKTFPIAICHFALRTFCAFQQLKYLSRTTKSWMLHFKLLGSLLGGFTCVQMQCKCPAGIVAASQVVGQQLGWKMSKDEVRVGAGVGAKAAKRQSAHIENFLSESWSIVRTQLGATFC